MPDQTQSRNENLLKHVVDLEIEAKQFGFYWEKIEDLVEQIRSECLEIEEAFQKGDKKHLQEEIGDVILAAISLAIFCNYDPEITLKNSIEKYKKRYHSLVKIAKEDGHQHLRNQSMDVLMDYWNKAKKEN